MASTSNSHKEEALFRSRVEDTIQLAQKRNYAAFLGFLDEYEQAEAESVLRKLHVENALFFGGYSDSERCMLGVFAYDDTADTALFPLRTVAFHYRSEVSLSHRDVLGTLMSIGLRRDAIGDILCTAGLSVLFLREEICTYVSDQVTKIGGESVRVELDYVGDLPSPHTFMPIRDTVASPRLDAIVSSLVRCSREQSAQLIRSDMVSVDRAVIRSTSHAVSESQTVTVRGHGKFIIDELGPETKKGRLRFGARKYI